MHLWLNDDEVMAEKEGIADEHRGFDAVFPGLITERESSPVEGILVGDRDWFSHQILVFCPFHRSEETIHVDMKDYFRRFHKNFLSFYPCLCYNRFSIYYNIVSEVNEVKKNKTQNKKKEPMIKTRVRRDQSIEVELKSPTKSTLGKVLIIIIVAGMTVFTLFSLIYLMIQAM